MPAVTIGSEEVPPDELNEVARDPGSPAEVDGTKLPIPQLLTEPTATAYEFLVDGARAIAAFCRPFPVKTVGKPSYINYNIAEATFTLSVKVEPSDAQAGEATKLPTEIYIPLTTFSSPPTLYPIPTQDEDEAAEEAEAVQEAVGSGASSPSQRGALPNKIPEPQAVADTDARREHTVKEALSRLHLAFAGNRSRAAAGYSLHLSSDPPLPLDIPDKVLDIEVDVSAGDWEVKGQSILWYYDVPKEGSETYTLNVRKRNAIEGQRERSGKGDGCILM